jgi:hypothetical protein
MRMPFGKHKGEAVSDLPDDYLEWLAANVHLFGALRREIRYELEDRGLPTDDLDASEEDDPFQSHSQQRQNGYGSPPPPPPRADGAVQVSVAHADADMLWEILRAGYKGLAMLYHPDRGGGDLAARTRQMQELNRVMDLLRKQLNRT